MQRFDRGRDCSREDDASQRPPATTPDVPGTDVKHAEAQGPQEIELLLDGERPEMQDRIRVYVRGEVVGGLVDEVPVGDINECARNPPSASSISAGVATTAYTTAATTS